MTRLGMRPTRRGRGALGSALLLGLLGLSAPSTGAVHALGRTGGLNAPMANLPAGLAPVVRTVLRRATAPDVAWSQQAQITATDGAFGSYFGVSVAVSGTVAVVGAYHEAGKGVNTGAAYVFVRGAAGWTQQAKLSAADGFYGDFFGVAVALSGNTTVIGAPHKNRPLAKPAILRSYEMG